MKTKVTIILGIALFMLSGIEINAQKGFNLSVHIAPQNSWLINADDYDDNGFEYKALVLPAFGIGATYNFTDNLGAGLEFNYSMQGQKSSYLDIETTTRLDYLKIPILFHYNTSPANKLMLSANVGPQFNILTDARLLDEDGEELSDDISEAYMDMTFGALVSIGLEYKLTDKINFFSLLKYDLDFTNAEDEESIFYQDDRAITLNSSLGLQMGLKFSF